MNNDSVSLSDYFRVIQRRWLTIAATVLFIVAAVGVYSLVRTPEYTSFAEVQVPPAASDSDAANAPTREEELADVPYLAKSEAVSRRVREELNRDIPFGDVQAAVTAGTSILRITASAEDPQAAADIANASAEEFLDYRREQLDKKTENGLENLANREEALREDIDEIDKELEDIEDGSTEAQSLQAKRSTLRDLLNNVTSQIANLETKPPSNPGTVIRSAAPSSSPINPKPDRDLALAFVVALLLGGAIAFTRDHFDDTIHDQKVLGRVLGERNVLGVIPKSRRRKRAGLVTADEPRSALSEAFQTLSANVRGVLAGLPPHRAQAGTGRAVLVTASGRKEDGASVAANLAVANARAGLRVALVDADFRRPGIGPLFGLTRNGGLSEVVAGRVGLEERCHDVGVRNLMVLPAGPVPSAPAEMLADPRMSAVLGELALRADLVIVSSAPAQFADPVELGLRMDYILLVIDGGVSGSDNVSEAMARLENAGAPIGIAFDDSKRPGALSLW